MRLSIKYKYLQYMQARLYAIQIAKYVVENKFQTFFRCVNECYDANFLI